MERGGRGATPSLGWPMTELPRGTITFLFTDVEGSTRLLRERGESYAALLIEHRRVLREVFARHEGVEVDTGGGRLFRCLPLGPEGGRRGGRSAAAARCAERGDERTSRGRPPRPRLAAASHESHTEAVAESDADAADSA